MSISKKFEHLYSPADSSAFNQKIGNLLDMALAHEGRQSFKGNYDAEITAAEKELGLSGKNDPRGEEVKVLIGQLRSIGPPPNDPPNPDSEKPKGSTSN